MGVELRLNRVWEFDISPETQATVWKPQVTNPLFEWRASQPPNVLVGLRLESNVVCQRFLEGYQH